MQDFEKLGVFYLGREYDMEKKSPKENLLLYDSKDLLTHAVCVGMTGSGKTGLCIGLLEEAAIDGIPSLVIDPKGDLSNLLLTFPDLKADDFNPWVNEEDARRKGVSAEEHAGKQALVWKKGLADWGQDSERIRRLRDSADFLIYTPGSSAGLPVSILKSFEAPSDVIIQDPDLLRERINTTVTGLLSLLGIDADPIQSREHILLSTILDAAWKRGDGPDLGGLIRAIQTPPVSRVGVFDLESYFPSNERFSLAMKMNNLLAAPGFQTWLEGEAMDIDRILYTDTGKPKVSIFSISHLSDAERMFFVSLLLTQILGWMRTQSGTTSLRALLYMDEIFGYLPPVANPPSKAPLLTLLKQARAFGLGIVLATQNPVDLDYKGLSNTGTWFIGRLQTERDKMRVIEGLEGAGSSGGGRFDRQKLEQVLAGLRSRVFLMNNVHEDEPVLFETRWVMSYLRGPLTRDQIKLLMDERKTEHAKNEKVPEPLPAGPETRKERHGKSRSSRALLPPGISQYFVPVRGEAPDSSSLFYEPMLLRTGRIFYADARSGITHERYVALLTEFTGTSSATKWEDARVFDMKEDLLEKIPEDEDAHYGDLPKEAVMKGRYTDWSRELREWLYRNQRLELMKSPLLGVVSAPGEPERDFRIRLQQAAREKRDMRIEQVRKTFVPKVSSLEERIRKAEQALEREAEQEKQQKLQTAISFGTTLLSSLFGRKKLSRSSLGRAATTAGRAGRILKEKEDVRRAEENVDELRGRLLKLQALLEEETEAIKNEMDPLTEELEPFVVTPKKKDITISLVTLVWVPFWQNGQGRLTRAS